MKILVEFIFTISVERSGYRLMFSGAGKFYSPVVTFMNRELNKAFKSKTQRMIYGCWGGYFLLIHVCLFVFSWGEFIIPFTNLNFYIKTWWEGFS